MGTGVPDNLKSQNWDLNYYFEKSFQQVKKGTNIPDNQIPEVRTGIKRNNQSRASAAQMGNDIPDN